MERIDGIEQAYIDLKNKYRDRVQKFSAQEKKQDKLILLNGWLRLISFLLVGLSLFLLLPLSGLLTTVIAVVLIIAFAYLIKQSIYFKIQKKRFSHLAQLNKNEILALNGDWSVFENGSEFICPEHDFSHDLDIYGEASIFQYINRTSTLGGKNFLNRSIDFPKLNSGSILNQQKATQELAEQLDFRQEFYAQGKILQETQEDHQRISDWKTLTFIFANKSLYQWMVVVLPALFFASIAATFWGLPGNISVIIFLFNLGWIGAKIKAINKFYQQVSSLSRILNNYSKLLYIIQSSNFSAPLLKEQAAQLQVGSHNASAAIKKIGKYIGQLDQRNNMIAGIVLNGIFLWDIKYIIKIEKWSEKHREDLANWIKVVHQFDALNSIGGFAYNHPDFCLPQISDQSQTITGKALGHPLLAREDRICNDYQPDKSVFTMLTGANMSGKSTFLRTVGINLVLANMGAVVCAREMKFVPTTLVTNMRAVDSLTKHESYFYAELKRLKMIVDRLKEGQNLYVILDEILKGTNSKDKTSGSMKLVKQLTQLHAFGIIATHDLELGVLETELNHRVKNMCFEVTHAGDHLVFDYLLHLGITQNHNASFLMKKMGIIEE